MPNRILDYAAIDVFLYQQIINYLRCHPEEPFGGDEGS